MRYYDKEGSKTQDLWLSQYALLGVPPIRARTVRSTTISQTKRVELAAIFQRQKIIAVPTTMLVSRTSQFSCVTSNASTVPGIAQTTQLTTALCENMRCVVNLRKLFLAKHLPSWLPSPENWTVLHDKPFRPVGEKRFSSHVGGFQVSVQNAVAPQPRI